MFLVLSILLTQFSNALATDQNSNSQQTKIYIGNGYEVIFNVTSQWKDAFNADVILKNTGDEPIENWSLKFNMPHEITNIWNAVVISNADNNYIVKNTGSNQDVEPGKSISFGFTANSDDEIEIPDTYQILSFKKQVPSDKYEISFAITSDWGSAFNGEISIKNISDEVIEDWQLEFDFALNIERFWTAEIVDHSDGHYHIKNAGYNSNIKPGETITLGFSGNPGDVKFTPSNYILTNIVFQNGYYGSKDWDNDGIDNDTEISLGWDPNNSDSNDNGIPDGYEYYVLLPASFGHVDIKDAFNPNNDFDNDGLNSLQEYIHGTNPSSRDTDKDGLSDYDEVYVYFTNPCVKDTDGDGLNDGTEIMNGLNPLVQDSDGNGIIDGQEIFEQKLVPSEYEQFDLDESLVVSEISILGSGDYSEQIDIVDASINGIFDSINSMIGKPIDIRHEKEVRFDKAKITFTVSQEVLDSHNINDLRIAYYNSKKNILEILDTTIESNKLSSTVDHFSYYLVVDYNQYLYDIDYANESSTINNGKADVVFAIDTTRSMSGTINNVKNNITTYVNKLKEEHVDIRLGLVEFRDITVDGKASTKDHGWFLDVDSFIAELKKLNGSGGGDTPESAVDALETARRKSFRNNIDKYIVLITDANYKNGTNYDITTMEEEISRLKADGVNVSVISSSSYRTTYSDLYTQTGGIFANINENFATALEPLIKIIDDDVNDGVWIRLSNGCLVKLDKDPELGDYEVDTDGDGVPDLIELEEKTVITVSPGGYSYTTEAWTFTSNPTVIDTDNDGIKDGLDARPSEYDVRITSSSEKEITFNNGKKWLIFGRDIYWFIYSLGNPNYPFDDYLSEGLEILVQNDKTDFDKYELAILANIDINGVREYLTIREKALREDVFKLLTGRSPKYYKHKWLVGWEEITPRQEEWYDFFTGDIKSEADATLTVYYDADLNHIIKGVVFVGIIVGASYLVISEVALIIEACSVYGIYNTLTMYFNGGSTFLQVMLADWYSDGDSDVIDIAMYAKDVVTLDRDPWQEPPVIRGDIIDDALGNNLGHNFPTVDRLENQLLTSFKSIDTTAATYRNGAKLYSKIVRDIRELDAFTSRYYNGVNVTINDYSAKALEVAIPNVNISLEQMQAFEAAKAYAANLESSVPIEVIIRIVKGP